MLAWLLAIGVALAALPTVSLDDQGLTIVHSGKTLRLAQPGLRSAQLQLVPLRTDGSEFALWASVESIDRKGDGERGLLIRLTDPPTVIYSVVPTTSVPHISRTTKSVWIVDVDGDGWNDVLEYATTFSDVGGQAEAPALWRFQPDGGRFGLAGRRRDQPRPPGTEPRRLRLEGLFGGRRVERRALIDGHSLALPFIGAPTQPGLGGNSPPFVGDDLLLLAIERGALHLVHARVRPKLALVRDVELGPIRFGALRCDETLRVRDGAVIIEWSPDGATMHERRVAWDGKTLSAAATPAVALGPCAAR